MSQGPKWEWWKKVFASGVRFRWRSWYVSRLISLQTHFVSTVPTPVDERHVTICYQTSTSYSIDLFMSSCSQHVVRILQNCCWGGGGGRREGGRGAARTRAGVLPEIIVLSRARLIRIIQTTFLHYAFCLTNATLLICFACITGRCWNKPLKYVIILLSEHSPTCSSNALPNISTTNGSQNPLRKTCCITRL